MAKKDRITKGLREIGAAWAGSADRYICTRHQCCNLLDGDKRAYHVHPDASYPHQDDIKRFSNLDEIAGYIKARKQARAALDWAGEDPGYLSPEQCRQNDADAQERAYQNARFLGKPGGIAWP